MQTLPQIFAIIVVKYAQVHWKKLLTHVFWKVYRTFLIFYCSLDFYWSISLQHFSLLDFSQCIHALTLDLEHNAYHVQHAVFAVSHVMSTVRVERALLRCRIETIHVLKSQLGGACRWPAKGVRSLISLATPTAIGQRHLQLQLALTVWLTWIEFWICCPEHHCVRPAEPRSPHRWRAASRRYHWSRTDPNS